ncbi:MAG TPA: FtsX-like permease family protein [Thermoanaerobaculia bacterium]|nr:FtsX-like permease family protein [Thermoanaerobaculia bacterium]
MRDTLRYYWRSHVAVVAGATVATAVLTGALLVGDSVRGSLRELALDRLGEIDHALLAEGFFREELARSTGGVPVVLLQGAAVSPGTGLRASGVNVLGIDGDYAALYPEVDAGSLDLSRAEGQFFPSVVINTTLQRELGVAEGDQVLLRLGRPADVPRETLMGSTEASDVVQTLRVAVRSVIPDRGPGRFGLALHQSVQRNAFLPLADLQRALDQQGRVNGSLYRAIEGTAIGGTLSSTADGGQTAAAAREALLREHLALDDLGVEAVESDSVVVVRSREILLRPALEEAVRDFARDQGLAQLRVSTYLANLTRRVLDDSPDGTPSFRDGTPSPELYLPYSTITALSSPLPEGGGQLLLVDGTPAPDLGEGEVFVNEWAARDLGVRAGDRVTVTYWEVGEREELTPRDETLRVAGVVRLSGLGADRGLAPDFPGVADAGSMSEWDPTFPVDLGLIRDRDEEYWDRWGAAPKLFVAEEVGRRLWGNDRFGALTEIRLVAQSVPATAEATDDSEAPREEPAAELASQLRDRLAGDLPLRAAGLSVVPLRSEALDAGQGATDFAGLFVGFSLFLIVSAILLVALFFRLGVERRVREIGLRLAIGEGTRRVTRGLLAEGASLAALGAALGAGAAVAYAAAMVFGLRTLWAGAVGGADLRLFVAAPTLILGALGSLLVVLVTLAVGLRQLARRPVVPLLRGEVSGRTAGEARGRTAREARGRTAGEAPRVRRLRIWFLSFLSIAAGLFAGSFAVDSARAAPLFFGLGAALLAAGLSGFLWLLARHAHDAQGAGALLGAGRWRRVAAMAAANLTLYPGRSLLSVSLVASATFVIVAVGAYGHDFRHSPRDRSSGTGGFQLVAESDVALFHDLGTPQGRAELGFDDEEGEPIAASTVMPFRLLPGDDVSCLNLYRPQQPRLLGVPRELIERGGFSFQQVLSDGAADEEPWRLLEQDLGPDVVPAIGDFNSVTWILHSGIGDEIVVEDDAGRPLRLRIVGLLRKSLFQSELLVSEAAFLRHFPTRSGYRFFLVDAPPGREEEVAMALEGKLDDFGFDASSAAERLQSYQAVENTYLATFQTLGGLGLLLGTFGLAVILVRNVLERVSELATLRALGYRRATLGWLVFAENALLLLAGLTLGTLAALVAVAPHLASGGALVPWATLSITLGLVAVIGLAASAAAVRQVLRAPLLPALRAE